MWHMMLPGGSRTAAHSSAARQIVKFAVCCLAIVCTGSNARAPSAPSPAQYDSRAYVPAPANDRFQDYADDGLYDDYRTENYQSSLLERCNELYRDTRLDHFSWASTLEQSSATSAAFPYGYNQEGVNARKQRFPQRYFVCDQYWSGTGPIFFYFGAEGSITGSVLSAGLMWESAAELSALLVFAEHRYYGKSKPFAAADNTLPENIKYLSMAQAMADYADLLTDLKAERQAESSPVIGFGESYGGIVAAFFRLKYPHILNAAIASSAPVNMFERPLSSIEEPTVNPGFYAKGVAEAADSFSHQCVLNMRRAFQRIFALGETIAGAELIESAMNLCEPLSTNSTFGGVTAYDVASWASGVISGIAQYNYPEPQYSRRYVQTPVWPLATACAYMDRADPDIGSDSDLLSSLADAASMSSYHNHSVSSECNEVATPSDAYTVDGAFWDYQTCTELPWPESTNGVDDMFWAAPWNRTSRIANCKASWGVEPDFLSVAITYGTGHLDSLSNVVFSNGLLDPYHAAGVLTDLSDTVTAIVMPEAAHCVDFRSFSPADPASVLKARDSERRSIRAWVAEAQAAGKHWP